MPKNRQGNNKLEPAAEASANANLADDADINDQHVVLNAIASLKRDLVAKIEEKAIAQSAPNTDYPDSDGITKCGGTTPDPGPGAPRSPQQSDTRRAPTAGFYCEMPLSLRKRIAAKESNRDEISDDPDGDQIRLLPDFTQAVSKQRAAFTEVRGLLRNCEGVRYGLKYPAILMITTSGGHEASFSDPKLAKEFVLNKVVRKAS
ncbi:LINE-1 retrotransposable element ORF1 protein [Dissostichus eleginoides]|uniref:LINE-1 retrotransposable element ORF1 protein n=1 Tax=Dissostichus eleginoides TaxID=100907 RepID=A0AAD9FII1_DISEL|nr:LINE-1 retrotransposable element ORF1 protein [Dissostichus eleginoides]